MAEVILKAKNLVKNYGEKKVLKGVNLDIRAGEIFGIIGSSGSGKTTLLNSLIGFVAPSSGEILFRDPHLLSYNEAGEHDTAFRNVLHYPKQVKEIFGFSAQDPSLYSKLTVMENLDLFGSLYNLSKNSRQTNAHILLKLMGLYNARKLYASDLSGGMTKRLDIACSLIHDPKVLILDEPTADLDPYLRRHMWDLIRKINRKGTTIIISSHYLDEIEELCDRIGIMSAGEIKHYGTPDQIKTLDDGSEEIHVRTESKRYDLLMRRITEQKASFGVVSMRNNGPELVLRAKKPLPLVEFIVCMTTKIEDPIVDLRLNKPSLNEIFANFVEESQGGNLAKHQQNMENEAIELAKTKRWYKFKTKVANMCRSKKKKGSRADKSVSDEFDSEATDIRRVKKSRSFRRNNKQGDKSRLAEKLSGAEKSRSGSRFSFFKRKSLDDSPIKTTKKTRKVQRKKVRRSEEKRVKRSSAKILGLFRRKPKFRDDAITIPKRPLPHISSAKKEKAKKMPKAYKGLSRRKSFVRSPDRRSLKEKLGSIFSRKRKTPALYVSHVSRSRESETMNDLASLRKRIEKLRLETDQMRNMRRKR